MKQITLKVPESKYALLLQFLKSITYVEIETAEVQAIKNAPKLPHSDVTYSTPGDSIDNPSPLFSWHYCNNIMCRVCVISSEYRYERRGRVRFLTLNAARNEKTLIIL